MPGQKNDRSFFFMRNKRKLKSTGEINRGNGRMWLVSEYFYPCDNATGYIMTSVAKIIAKQSPLNVITTTNLGRFPEIDAVDLNIIRIRDSELNKDHLFQRLLRIILLSVRLFRAVLKHVKREDVLITVTNPTALTLLLKLAKNLRGFNVVLIVHDLFPENLAAGGIVGQSNPAYRIVRGVFNRALSGLDAILVVGRDMEVLMQRKLRRKEVIHYLPNFADTGAIVPSDKMQNELVSHNNLADKLIVLFTGNIGRVQHIGFICEVMLAMKEHNEVHFLFIGEGAMKPFLSDFLIRHDLTNATLLPMMPRESENIFLNAGDVGLVILPPGFKGLGVPSKSYSYMAAGKPLLGIVDHDSEIGLLISEHDVGWQVDPDNVTQCVDRILQLKADVDSVRQKGERARLVCERYFTPEKYTFRLMEIVNRIKNDGSD